jgi:hypothetical protein
MIKYVSMIFFMTLLGWSWGIVHSSPKISFETHAGIQEKLADLIKKAVQERKPDATELSIDQLWTEIISETSLKAHFSYSYKNASEDGRVNSSIRGFVLLNKVLEPTETEENETWKVAEVKTTNNALVFEEGLLINAGDTPESETPAVDKPTETKSEP